MLRVWDALIGCAAMFAIVLTAFQTMLQIVEVPEAMRRIVAIGGCALLLTILPSIITGIWSGISVWQKIGILTVVGMAVAIFGSRRRFASREKTSRH